LMDWEKLLDEELCWDCWKNDWKEGAICWKGETIPPKEPPKVDWKLCMTWLIWLKTLFMTDPTFGIPKQPQPFMPLRAG